MLSVLYDIVISPLVYLIELVFSLGYRITDSAGLAIIGVSLAVNLLCLPLYRMADAAQDAERDRQNSMKKWVDHINHHFSGDERVMVLQAYYRLRHYHPAQALMGSLSLLLQIPSSLPHTPISPTSRCCAAYPSSSSPISKLPTHSFVSVGLL